MKNLLIIHDTDEIKSRHKREEHWYSWLRDKVGIDEEAEDAGSKGEKYRVFLQEMPLSWKPSVELYWNFLKEKFNFNNESVLVGHGTGATALLGILEKVPQVKSVNMVVLVSPLLESNKEEYRGLFSSDFDWEDIKKKAKVFYVLYSQDDDVVASEQSKKIAERLAAQEKEFSDKGHFERDELSELLDIISS